MATKQARNPEAYDLNKAWRFICESYDTYSPYRGDWSAEDILWFVEEYHVDGLDAFLR